MGFVVSSVVSLSCRLHVFNSKYPFLFSKALKCEGVGSANPTVVSEFCSDELPLHMRRNLANIACIAQADQSKVEECMRAVVAADRKKK